jgi:hypothetical protein
MSTTAGLGSGDYVAISGTAIAAILLGVGSSLVLFNNPILLVIPLLGVLAAILAFSQISQSNGTQTGRGVAVAGLLLSLGFGGFYGGKTVYSTYRNQSDHNQIVDNAHRLGELLKKQNYADAYSLMDDGFKRRVSLSQFETAWQRMAASPIIGGVDHLDWNHLLSFDTDPVDGSRIATGMMLLYARPAEPLRLNFSFRNENGSWQVDQIPQMFATDATASGGPETAGAGGASGKGSTFIGPPKP